jgi:hypothetical protein
VIALLARVCASFTASAKRASRSGVIPIGVRGHPELDLACQGIRGVYGVEHHLPDGPGGSARSSSAIVRLAAATFLTAGSRHRVGGTRGCRDRPLAARLAGGLS